MYVLLLHIVILTNLYTINNKKITANKTGKYD